MKHDLEKSVGLEYLRRFINRRWLLAAALICTGLLLAPHLYAWYHDDLAEQTGGKSSCSDGWYITGYYVPREDELPGAAEEIYVERVGTLSFSQEFLNETRTEGWGITRFGWALGHYGSGWHRSDAGPLDASGNVLRDGAIAIDRSLIPRGAKVQISTLPSPWGAKTFRATDTGAGIDGQHIDVFTGTGSAGEEETFRITSNNNRVCFTNGATGDTPSK
ncbi:MAG TPA: 3D domain-containing protein [Pyrinomonadaceae bacterium]|nr:3D domain-containing protein [Pyrinomonadaceae bacterium]